MTKIKSQKEETALGPELQEVLKINNTVRGSYNQDDPKMKMKDGSDDTDRSFTNLIRQLERRNVE